jgi:hypothetical protein
MVQCAPCGMPFEGMRAAHTDVVAEQETILCAGVIESPRLLMLSGIGNAEELRRYGISVVSYLSGVRRESSRPLFPGGIRCRNESADSRTHERTLPQCSNE